ncbi:MAG: SusC/RagA family TonB-linked outer membrane protein [Bacteroidales bacterium]|nr:SusC/RagA family TonB-linked outer membrane protein [Bacteroidales bacterium]
MGDYLRQISAQAGLRFEQVNNVIMVSRSEKDEVINTPVVDLAVQMRKITGQVMASEDNTPLPGVNITVQGTTLGVISDNEGRFSIDVPESATLVFSFVGYLTEAVTITGQTVLNISMIPDVKSLNEVVVIGYGSVKKPDLTGAVSTISSQQIDKIPTLSVANILQGKAAGVDVVSNTGEPGGGVTIRIRGTSTLNGGSSPLFIVDGVPLQTDGVTSLNMGGSALNPLADMDPSDIESIQVLKDAASAAIYGSRAANGVVIVTTKRGKAGKPTLNINSTIGVSKIANKIGVLNARQFRDFMFDKDMNNGGAPGAAGVDSLAGSNSGDTDFQDAMFRQALTKKFDAKISGGTDKLRYMISTGFLDQDGIVIKTNLKRINTRINVDYQAYENLKIGSNFSYTRSTNTRTDQGSNIKGVVSIPSIYPIFLSDGTYNVAPNDKLNPVAYANLIKNQAITNRFLGSEYFEWTPIKGLIAKSSFSVDYSDIIENVFRNKLTYIPKSTDHKAQYRGNKSLSWLTEKLTFFIH